MSRLSGHDLGLRKLIVLRILVVTIILASGAIIYFLSGYRTEAFYLSLVLALFYFLNLIYILVEPLFITKQLYFRYLIVFFDFLLSSIVLFVTGGKSSPFIFLFPLIIIFASILISRIASYITAALCVLSYVFIIFYQILSTHGFQDIKGIFTSGVLSEDYNLLYSYFHLIGFVLIAAFGGYLSERFQAAKKELGESKKSLNILQNLHQNILQSLTSGVLTLDLEKKVISINRTGLDILSINSVEELSGKELGSFVKGLEVEELINKQREQINYYTPEEKKLILGLSGSLLKDDMDVTQGYTVIFQDLTEVRTLEEKLRSAEKMALLGQLAGGLAHELRNPLSAISGTIELLSTEINQTEATYRLSKVASREIERLNLMVEDFLLLTLPIESLNTSLVDLYSILDETVNSFRNTVKRNNLFINLVAQKGFLVEADSYRLKQVFWNLLDNSMDSMPQGGKIDVKCYCENGEMKISFSDEGSGIDEENISKIFEPFFTTKNIGTGLGLAIVQKVIEGYNGNISVFSNKGSGTKIIISLPRSEN